MNYEPALYNTIAGFTRQDRISFHMPVHGGGALYGNPAQDFLSLDVTELPATDNLACPSGPIAQMHENMARLFGADHAHVLVGGSSAGLHAMLLACLRRGDTLLVDRCIHQSVLNACALYGFVPVFFERDILPGYSIPGHINPASLRRAIQDTPHAKAILITTPTYYGICEDVRALATLAHNQHIPLLADCAHGPHFAFCSQLPNVATADEADLCALSLHKTLGAPTQTALLLHRSKLVDYARVKACVNMVHTTSPSYLLMCAADLVCAKMAHEGEALFMHAAKLVQDVREQLEQGTLLRCLLNGDATRLVVNVSAYALNGYNVAQQLADSYAIDVEMADPHNIVCIFGPLTTEKEAKALTAALCAIVESAGPAVSGTVPPLLPPMYLSQTPADAFSSPEEYVPLDKSVGRVCAATVSAYPPGVPCLIPGARITDEATAYLRATLRSGGTVTGLVGESVAVLK